MELGLIEFQSNNSISAEKWLKKSLTDYNHYLNENYVHLRACAGLRQLGITNEDLRLDQMKSKLNLNLSKMF